MGLLDFDLPIFEDIFTFNNLSVPNFNVAQGAYDVGIQYPDFGSFDFEWPSYGDVSPPYYDPGGFGGGLGFETTTGQVILPGGQPFDYEGAAFGIPAGRAGVGYESPAFGGRPWQADWLGEEDVFGAATPEEYAVQEARGAGVPYDPRTGQLILSAAGPVGAGAAQIAGRAGVDGAVRGYPSRPGEQAGILKTINDFLGTPLGAALGAGLAGTAGLGAARLFAGEAPTLRLPSYTEAPETLALRAAAFPGQATLAGQLAGRATREAAAEEEQAPLERAFRMETLARMGAYLPGAGADDPIVAGLRAEAIRALEPGYTDPLVEESIRLAEADLMNRLVRQYGGLEAAHTSTPGIDVLGKFAAQRGLARAGARRQAISAYAPAAIEAQTGIQGLRRQNLGDIERLSRFGLRGAPETATTLGMLAGSPERANLVNLGLQGQQAMTAFNEAARSREQLASAIGGIAGQVGQAVVGQRPSRLEEALATYIGRQPRYG